MSRLPAPVTLNASIDTPLGETLTHAGAEVLLGQALRDLIGERVAQVDVHGRTIADDQMYAPDILPLAAASYLNAAVDQLTSTRPDGPDVSQPDLQTWPWEAEHWRPRDVRANLVKAAALIWAAIDRLDQAPRDAGDILPSDECAFCLRPSIGTVTDGSGEDFDACAQCITASRNDPDFFGNAGRIGTATCRDCGCTDARACMDGPEPCHWVAPDLCSACQRKAA